MNFLSTKVAILLFAVTSMSCQVSAKTIEFIEDVYAIQAPQEIVALAEKAAALVGFEKPYEVAVPQKAGVQINPWNKFAAYGINPKTNNPFIIINPQWFSKIPENQQLFWLSRCFITLEQGEVAL